MCPPLSCGLYQVSMTMTHEDCLSSERDRQPFGRILEAFGQRRGFGTMNHIAPSPAPCRKPPKYVLMGHSHRDLVLPPAGLAFVLFFEPVDQGLEIFNHRFARHLTAAGKGLKSIRPRL